jgi:hypothetical protein
LPLPVPEAAEVIESQLALLLALHPHPLTVNTLKLAAPPPAPNDWLEGDRL